MTSYYVNTNVQPNGDHEVHTAACRYLPDSANRLYLGEFATCDGAVTKARTHYNQSNGCLYCARACHTQ